VVHTLVVLPTYNEAATIGQVLRLTRRSLPEAEMLVVDDGSPDGTADLAEKASVELGGVHLLRRDSRRGLGDAYRAGFKWGLDRRFDALVEMDSDLSHDPAALPALIDGLSEYDLVVGSRYIPGGSVPQWTLRRRLLSWGGNRYAAVALGLPVRDMTSGCRAYRAELLRSLALDTMRAEGYGFQIEMTYRSAQLGANIGEVPIRFVDRQFGTSKMSGAIVLEAVVLVTQWGMTRVLSNLTEAGRRARTARWRVSGRRNATKP
jgi:dolichol-phosphate mannosyltransferase